MKLASQKCRNLFSGSNEKQGVVPNNQTFGTSCFCFPLMEGTERLKAEIVAYVFLHHPRVFAFRLTLLWYLLRLYDSITIFFVFLYPILRLKQGLNHNLTHNKRIFQYSIAIFFMAKMLQSKCQWEYILYHGVVGEQMARPRMTARQKEAGERWKMYQIEVGKPYVDC